MPKIIAELNGFDRYSWVTTAYLLTSTAILPVVGKLSDLHGRKWLLISSVIGFVLASTLCGLAGHFPGFPGDGMTQLIIFRGLQGIFGGGIMSLIFSAIGDLFPPVERGRYQGLFSAVWAFASVVGPVLGGWIADMFSWRWIFYVNVPVGVIAVAVLYCAFPRMALVPVKRPLDIKGLLTLVGWVVPLLLGLTWAPISGPSLPVVMSFVLAASMFIAFIFAEATAEEPMVPLWLFADPVVRISCLSLLLIGCAMFGVILFAPLYFQAVLGVSATSSGSELVPMLLMVTLGSAISGQLISRLDKYKSLALSGLLVMAFGLYLMSRFDEHTPHAVAIGTMVIFGSGLGLLMPIYTLVVQNTVEQSMLGVATSATQFCRSVGGTLGAAIFSSILIVRFKSHFDSHVPPGTPAAATAMFHNPLSVQHSAIPLSKALSGIVNAPLIQQQLLNEVKHAFTWSLDAIFFSAAMALLLGFIINFRLKEVPLRKTQHSPFIAAEQQQ